MSYSIIVDSCCDLTASMRSNAVFHIVPLTIHVADRAFVDDEHLRQDELLHAMADCPDAPHTSCPSPADYLDAFEAAEGDIYVVTLSAVLSGSHNCARQAAMMFLEEHPERNIYVFNSCSASSGEVLLALKLCELAATGAHFHEVVRKGNDFITEMQTLFILETLDNLRKNGRLTKMQAALTGTLKIKLLMGATPEGEICKRGQALSIKQGLGKLVQLMSADENHSGRTLCIAHCNCRERAEELRLQVLKHCDFRDVILINTHGISTVYANDGGIICAY